MSIAAPPHPRPAPPAARRLTCGEALVEALREELRRDPNVFLIGQDIGRLGGAMQGTRGLWEEFGPERVLEAPISESAIVGAGIGAALFGKRPVVEVSFGEFLPCAMSQLVLQAANMHYMTAGAGRVPLVVRTRVGDGPYRGHPQSYESWFPHVPGLKVVMPAFPADAYGLMRAAIRDDNPVLYFEHMYLTHGVRGEVPSPDADAEGLIPIGPLAVRREGKDVTVAATAWMVHKALRAAEELAAEGIDLEVLDLRTLAPLDTAGLAASVRKTGRLVVAHESWRIGGVGAEVAAAAAELAFDWLLAPPLRVAAPHVPVPSSQPLRDRFLPAAADIVSAVRQAMQYT